MKLGMAQINVTDLAEARRFYSETLGLPLRDQWGEGRPFELNLGPGPTVLVYPVEKSAPPEYPDQTGTTLVFYTEDLDRTMTEWTERGVEWIPIAWSKEPNGAANCPYGRFIAFRDPFGNVHELLQPKEGAPLEV